MPKLADTHCHLYFNLFEEDLPEVINRAQACGIENILLPGIDLETSEQAIRLSEQFPGIFAAVGVHPNDTKDWGNGTLDRLTQLARHPRVLAIGEIGLDFYRDRSPVHTQTLALKDQLALAAKFNKPVILHSRASESALLPILLEWHSQLHGQFFNNPGILHSFEGSLEQAKMAIDHHFMIGIGGPVTYKNATDKQILATKLPLSHIVLETDAPFLTPHPFRGQRNEPARILEIAKKIAELRRISLDEVALTTTKNADQLLGWSSFL